MLRAEVISSSPPGVVSSETEVGMLVRLHAKPNDAIHHHTASWSVKFLIDLSMSMVNDLPYLKQCLNGAIDALPDGSTLSIDTFAKDLAVLFPRTTISSQSRPLLKQLVAQCKCRGGTNLELAMQSMANEPTVQGHLNFGVIFTDGQPMQGERDPRALVAILPSDRVFHMVAYKSGSDCWVAKAFGERNVNNIIAYCTDADKIESAVERIFPTKNKLTIADIQVTVAPEAGVELSAVPSPIGNFAEDEVGETLIELRLPAAPIGAHKVADVTISYFDGELSMVVPLVVTRLERQIACLVPKQVCAFCLKREARAQMDAVQSSIHSQDVGGALRVVRALTEQAAELSQAFDDGDDGAQSLRSLTDGLRGFQDAFEAAEDGPQYRSLAADTLHELVDFQNAI